MMFALFALGLRWAALFIAGGSLQFLIFQNASVSDTLMTLGMSVVMWLFAKLITFAFRLPHFRVLNTRKKRIIAAIISLAMGFVLPMTTP